MTGFLAGDAGSEELLLDTWDQGFRLEWGSFLWKDPRNSNCVGCTCAAGRGWPLALAAVSQAYRPLAAGALALSGASARRVDPAAVEYTGEQWRLRLTPKDVSLGFQGARWSWGTSLRSKVVWLEQKERMFRLELIQNGSRLGLD